MTTPYVAPSGAPVLDLAVLPPAVPVSMGAGGTGGVVLTFSGLLLGWSVRETSGTAAATVVLYDGDDNTGQPAGQIALASGASSSLALPPPGLWFRNALYASVVSGAVAGVAWVVPLLTGA